MQRFRFCAMLALAFGLARPAEASSILYATAASERGVQGFPVNGDGSLVPEPTTQVTTGGIRPKRLLTHGCTLYVAEDDRVEVFRIHATGDLELIGATKSSNNMRAHDIALAPNGQTLYVQLRKVEIMGTYPLDANGVPSFHPVTENGVPAGQPFTCIYGSTGSGWEDMIAANDKLYVALGGSGRVFVYGVDATGNLYGTGPRIPKKNAKVDAATCISDPSNTNCECPFYSTTPAPLDLCTFNPDAKPKETRPLDTCPLSRRSDLTGALGLWVEGTNLFLSQKQTDNWIQGFTLASDGNFPPFGTNPLQPTKQEKTKNRKTRVHDRTVSIVRYIGLTFFRPSGTSLAPMLYGAAYKGWVDGFRLIESQGTPCTEGGSDVQTCLTVPTEKNPYQRTPTNRVTTPTRTSIGQVGGNTMLYVAAGEYDRVEAFHLFDGGSIPLGVTPQNTNPINGSFPNDVVVVDLTTCN